MPERDHLHRRRRGDPALPRLPDRAGCRAGGIPRDVVPPARGRAADRGGARALGRRRPDSHLRAHEHQRVPRGVPLRRPPDGDAARRRRRAVDVLPDAKDISDPENRYLQRVRLIAKLPTIAAYIFRHSRGLPYVLPRNDLDYIGNFVNMTFEIGGRHEPNPVLQRALEILLILHADHEQNCSTSAVRGVGSSHVDPFSAVSAGIAALYGPLHGGANEAVLQMLDVIGDKKNVPAFVEEVKAGNGPPDGFRPPRLQELRPAGQADQEGRRLRLRRDGPQSRSSRSLSSWSGSRSRTSTSSAASCIRTSTSTRA